MMKQFIFTFGFGQGHDNGYVVIWAKSQAKAEEKMVENYFYTWGFCYESPEKAGVEKYNLHLVKEIY